MLRGGLATAFRDPAVSSLCTLSFSWLKDIRTRSEISIPTAMPRRSSDPLVGFHFLFHFLTLYSFSCLPPLLLCAGSLNHPFSCYVINPPYSCISKFYLLLFRQTCCLSPLSALATTAP